MNAEIDRLSSHVIICGFGRIGVMLAKDAADEALLKAGGIERARVRAGRPIF